MQAPPDAAPDVPFEDLHDAATDLLQGLDKSSAPDYVAAMLGPLQGDAGDTFACRTPCDASVRTVSAAEVRHVRTAIADGQAAAKDFDGYAAEVARARREAAAADTPETHARLYAIARGEAPPLPPGDNVPYVKLPQPLTITETAQLWTLNPEQHVSFALLADVLQREKNGETVDPERMVLTGKAGTGKSRVLQALQWYVLNASSTTG